MLDSTLLRDRWRLGLAAIFLGLLATRIAAINFFGSPLPFTDQWDAEASALYVPYVQHTLTLPLLLTPQNEHRFIWTRLLDLGLLDLTGQWDTLWQMLAGAVIYCGAATYFTWLMGQILPARRGVIGGFCFIVFAVPFGWEDVLLGLGSQFYLFILFSILAVPAIAGSRALSPLWWLGFVAVLASYFNLASGAVTCFELAAFCALQMVLRLRSGWREPVGMALLAAAGAAMVAWTPTGGDTVAYRPQNLLQFVNAFIQISALPLVTIVGTVIVHAPQGWLALRLLRLRPAISERSWLLMAIGGWVLAQMLTLAYERAAAVTASRYLDIVALALPVEFIAVLMWRQASSGKLVRRVLAGWLIVMPVLLVALTPLTLTQMHIRKDQAVNEQVHVSRFLQTGNVADLGQPWTDAPYPDVNRLAMLLSTPAIRDLLPLSVMGDAATAAQIGRSRTPLFASFRAVRHAVLGGWWLPLVLALLLGYFAIGGSKGAALVGRRRRVGAVPAADR